MKKTNFTIHSFTRLAYCCLPVLLLVLSFTAPVQAQCNLVCNDHVNASMPADQCYRKFEPADFLQNLDCSSASYKVVLSYPYGTQSGDGTDVNRSQLGYTFVYSVKTADGNSCWGYVTVEDKAPPQALCKNRSITCYQVGQINDESTLNAVIDNCGEPGATKIEKLTFAPIGDGCSDPKYIAKVYRKIRTWDQWGNTGTCDDTLSVTRDSLTNIKCADLVAVECYQECTFTNKAGKMVTLKMTFTKDESKKFNKTATLALSNGGSPYSVEYYPSPDLLLFIKSCLTVTDANGDGLTLIVPYIKDSVWTVVPNSNPVVCTAAVACVPMYPSVGGLCKTTIGYWDKPLEICGQNGFKIRREWRIADWCSGKDTVCVQYIKVEDTKAPKYKTKDGIQLDVAGNKINTINGLASAHDCYATINLPEPGVEDCNMVDHSYIIHYQDVGHPGKEVVLSGSLPGSVKLPASAYGDCYTVNVRSVDKCYHDTTTTFTVCITDNTPPTPVCIEYTQTTVDPATCWARVYAQDLDHGSRDNCCNVLHFAVAHMDSLDYYRTKWTSYWDATCKADYWKYKPLYDAYLEEWINCYVFKDYIDLTECGTNQVVMRVYEACGVPRYDPHIFTPRTGNCGNEFGEHEWFCYNTSLLFRVNHNYNWFYTKGDFGFTAASGSRKCGYTGPVLCRAEALTWYWSITSGVSLDGTYYAGGVNDLDGWLDTDGSSLTICFDLDNKGGFDFTPLKPTANSTGSSDAQAPGNRCSERKHNDCMVNILVDDKTPPVCEKVEDIFWYCDGVSDVKSNSYEYARDACRDLDYDNNKADNAADYTCHDKYGTVYDNSQVKADQAFGNIECVKENDGVLTDTLDGTGVKSFGWYGCSIYGPVHQDEHGGYIDQCNPLHNMRSMSEISDYKDRHRGNAWSPIYCHTWLCLDKTDKAGQVNPKDFFWKPILLSGGPNGTPVAGYEKGDFKIWDNCWIGTPTVKDTQYIDNCGNGWISRTWTVGDKCDNSKVSCTQKIYTKHRSDFEVMFPADVTVACEADAAFSPDVTGRPMVMDDECELVGVNYEDVRYDIIPDACYKIIRTWKLIDWCKYDPNVHDRDADVIIDDRFVAGADRYCVYRKLKDDGDGFITYTQIIKVIDTIPPSVTCKDTLFCYYGGYAGAGAEPDPMCTVPTYTSPDFAATDNCTPANLISFRWELDLNYTSTKSIDKKSGPNMKRFVSSDLTPGKHKLYVIAEDNCGKEDTASCIIEVKDCKKPTPYCYNGIATVIMPSNGSVVVWATDLNAGSYDNCTKKADLTYTFASATGAASDTFTCADVPNGVSATVEVDIYVTDKAGNSDFCRTYLLIQDGNGNICQDQAGVAAVIGGKVATESTEPVENVILESKTTSNAIPAFKTDSKGTYSFSGLPMKGDYSITPKRDDDPTNGVSTIDLVLIQKHILGVQPLNSAYKVIAADVDRSNDVSAVDLVELRKLILTVYDKLPNNTSWRFVPKTYNFSNITTPWGFPEKIDINGLSKDELSRDFVGVKIGDVNGTVTPHSLLGAEAREAGASLKFRTSDRQMKAGEEAVIEFTAENFSNIEGYQFSMAVRGLELKSINSGILKVSESNFGMTKLGEGYVTTSWNDSKGISAGSNDILFSIKVKATKALTLSESLIINSKYTRAEAYNGAGSLGVALEVGKNSVAGYALHQNTPNPFKATTVISYELAKADKVTLKITDVTGKVVRVYTQDGVKGFNQKTVNRNEVGGAGVMYYTIETKDYSATKKMILVD